MGQILQARCKCGFQSEELYAGGGFFDFIDNLHAPALCGQCQQLVMLNYLYSDERCPTCGGEVIYYNDPSLQEPPERKEQPIIFNWRIRDSDTFFILPDTHYLCPRCGQKRMKFFDCGCWD